MGCSKLKTVLLYHNNPPSLFAMLKSAGHFVYDGVSSPDLIVQDAPERTTMK